MREQYSITGQLAGMRPPADRPITDKDGNVLINKDDQLKKWAEHFRKLPNRPVSATKPTAQPLHVSTSKPSRVDH